jgi:hypothetical protein
MHEVIDTACKIWHCTHQNRWLKIQISSRKRSRIQKGFSPWIRGPGRILMKKNRKSKFSRHCPFSIIQSIEIGVLKSTVFVFLFSTYFFLFLTFANFVFKVFLTPLYCTIVQYYCTNKDYFLSIIGTEPKLNPYGQIRTIVRIRIRLSKLPDPDPTLYLKVFVCITNCLQEKNFC